MCPQTAYFWFLWIGLRIAFGLPKLSYLDLKIIENYVFLETSKTLICIYIYMVLDPRLAEFFQMVASAKARIPHIVPSPPQPKMLQTLHFLRSLVRMKTMFHFVYVWRSMLMSRQRYSVHGRKICSPNSKLVPAAFATEQQPRVAACNKQRAVAGLGAL